MQLDLGNWRRPIFLLMGVLRLFWSEPSYGQSELPDVIFSNVISAGGASFVNDGIQLDWTLGEIQTESFESADLLLTQGFHQTFMIITSVEEPILLNIVIYPNPTLCSVFYKMSGEFSHEADSFYILLDVSGKTILSGLLHKMEGEINLSNVSAGVFILKVRQGNATRIFKLIKR